MKLDLKKDINKDKVCRERKQHMLRLWSGNPEHEQMKSEKGRRQSWKVSVQTQYMT